MVFIEQLVLIMIAMDRITIIIFISLDLMTKVNFSTYYDSKSILHVSYSSFTLYLI